MIPAPVTEGVVITDPTVLLVFAGPFLVIAACALVAGVVRLVQSWRRS